MLTRSDLRRRQGGQANGRTVALSYCDTHGVLALIQTNAFGRAEIAIAHAAKVNDDSL
jgi:hypothetical protein